MNQSVISICTCMTDAKAVLFFALTTFEAGDTPGQEDM